MSGVEEVRDQVEEVKDLVEEVKDLVEEEKPPDNLETETNTMASSWTLLEKEEPDLQQNASSSIEGGTAAADSEKKENEETDSESIVTLSDEEIMVSQSLGPSVQSSFCYIQGVETEGAGSSEEAEAGRDVEEESQDDQGQEEIDEEGDEPDQDPEDVSPEPLVQNLSCDGMLEPGSPGYDLDDDGLPGEPLPPLPQEVELYPSQELDPGFQAIQKEKVYKHYNNLQVDHFLSAVLILALALVIGLGIGHFLGLSERLEVQEMFENLQEERLDNLQDDLVTCINGDEGQGGDDQDLDDRVIKKLWEENQELRDQVNLLRNGQTQADEAMAAILRDKINELLRENANLEREVSRLRAAETSRHTPTLTERAEEDIQTEMVPELAPGQGIVPTHDTQGQGTDTPPGPETRNKKQERQERQETRKHRYDDDDDDDGDDDDDDDYKHRKSGDKHKKVKYRDDHESKKYRNKRQGKDYENDNDDYYKKKKRYRDDDDDDDDDDDNYKKEKYKKKHRKEEKYRRRDRSANTSDPSWYQRRGEQREMYRRENSDEDWTFKRAKHRKDVRYEETRGDWYFQRKRMLETDQLERAAKGELFGGEKKKKSYKLRGESLGREDSRKYPRHFDSDFTGDSLHLRGE